MNNHSWINPILQSVRATIKLNLLLAECSGLEWSTGLLEWTTGLDYRTSLDLLTSEEACRQLVTTKTTIMHHTH